MDYSLPNSPHGRVYRSHEEIAVLVDEGNGCGGDKPEGERDHEAHDEDHHAVESPQFVSPQSGESDQPGYHVDDSAGENAPNKDTQPDDVNIFSY